MADANNRGASLLCGIGVRLYAIPIEHVVETMRPLPVEPVDGAPSCVRGVAIIRGAPVPVVDLALLVGLRGGSTGRAVRFVTLRAADSRMALAVDRVVGVRVLADGALHDLPPLPGDDAAAVAGLGPLHAPMLSVLAALSVVAVPPDASVDGHGVE